MHSDADRTRYEDKSGDAQQDTREVNGLEQEFAR